MIQRNGVVNDAKLDRFVLLICSKLLDSGAVEIKPTAGLKNSKFSN